MGHRKTAISIRNENRALRAQIDLVKEKSSLQNATALNSLTDLVEGIGLQSNLTSLNPLIQNNLYAPLTLNWPILTYMYKTHGIIQSAIDMPVQDALRGGIEIRSNELSHDEIKDVDDFMEEFGVLDSLGEAFNWVRLYGGGALIVNTNQDPATPLSLNGLTSLEFYAANRWELQTPGMNPKVPWDMLGFGVPMESESFLFYGRPVHRSRVLTMSGKAAPHLIRWQLQGWGMSEVEKMVEDFNKYLRTNNVLYELLEEAKIDVYKLEGYKDQLMSAAGTAGTKRRIELTNQMKNFNNAIILDVKDDYQQKQLTFSGLAEVMKENRIALASALRIPMTKLFGQSASGFNSGEDDIENYNAMVESEVRKKLRAPIRKILKLISIVKFGQEFDFSFDFPPLRIMSSVDEETVKTSKQNRIHQNYHAGLLTAQEAADAMEHEKLISGDTAVAKGMEPVLPNMGGEEGGALPVGGKPKEKGEGENG